MTIIAFATWIAHALGYAALVFGGLFALFLMVLFFILLIGHFT